MARNTRDFITKMFHRLSSIDAEERYGCVIDFIIIRRFKRKGKGGVIVRVVKSVQDSFPAVGKRESVNAQLF
jgi:hypothetical protein